MKLDKAFMKKHQFWLLLGLSVFLWVVSLALVLISPGAKAAKVAKDFKTAEDDYKKPRDPKNQSFIDPWVERQTIYTKRKNDVWEVAWKTQDGLMTWPSKLEGMQAASFGAPIDVDSIQRYKGGEYHSQFVSLDAFLALRGGEQLYFPVVYGSGVYGEKTWKEDQPPTAEECWLAQEEIWVRREVFKVLTAALKSIGKFKEVREPLFQQNTLTGAGGGALSALVFQSPAMQKVLYKERPVPAGVEKSKVFRNHSWEVNLLFERDAVSGRMQVSAKSTIKNINPTGRSMLLVNGGRGLLLRIRQDNKTLDLARIEGQLLPPGGSSTFEKATPVAAGMDVAAAFELEEIFDYATSPVKRLEALEVGPAAQAHRLAVAVELVPNKLAPTEDPAAGAMGAMGGMGQLGGGGMMGQLGGGMMGQLGGGGMMGQLGGGMMGQSGGGSKTDKTSPNEFVRKRYTICTDQVRCLPVGFVVVIDQAHLAEVLAAVANSRLRIQTSQVHWRHRDGSSIVAAAPSAGGAGGMGAGGGTPGGMGAGGGTPGGMGAGGGTPMGSRSGPPGGTSSKDGPPGGMGGGTVTPGGNPMTEDKAPAAASVLAEDNRNLIELSVYGVATMFERFKLPPPPAPEQPGQPKPPN